MFSRILKTSILDLQTLIGGQNTSEFNQEDNFNNTKVKQATWCFKVEKIPFLSEKSVNKYFFRNL